jgi:hypothetical protein
MKIIDVPQTGKLGLTVTYPSRNGLIRRSWVVPANPQTADQLVVRSRLANRAAAYDALTEAQQDAWIAAAAQEQSRPTLGQSGPLTGLQLYLKINANLEMVGEPTVTTPPAKPTFTGVVTTGLVITNTGGTIAIKLAASGSSSAFQLVRGASPQNSGTRRIISKRYLGQLPEVTGGFATITTIYSDKFGVPATGQRIFITVNEMADGWQGIESVYTALVPASS